MSRTPLIQLRAPEMADLESRYRWLNDPDVNQYLWQGQQWPLPKERVREELEQVILGTADRMELAVVRGEGELIGFAALSHLDHQNGKAELSVVIGEKDAWGGGYGAAAVQAVLRLAFLSLRLNKVWLQVDAEHGRAIRLYERLGFSQEGLLREDWFRRGRFADTVVMAVLAREWLAMEDSATVAS